MENAVTTIEETAVLLRAIAGDKAYEVATKFSELATSDAESVECECGGCDYCRGRVQVLNRLRAVREVLTP